MANLCSSQITFYSKNQNALADFKEKLEKYTKSPYKHLNNSISIKNVLEHYLDGTSKALPDIDYRCDIQFIQPNILQNEYDKDYYSFYVETESAWTINIKAIIMIIEKFYNNEIEIAFISEEAGCEYFLKLDTDDLFYSDHDFFWDIVEPPDEFVQKYPEYQKILNLYDVGNESPISISKYNLFKTLEVNNTKEAYKFINSINDKLDEEYPDGGFFVNIARYRYVESVYDVI